MNSFKQPEIFYQQDPEGITNGIPFVNAENFDSIPRVLFIGAAIDSDEKNEDNETIVDFVMNAYYNSGAIKSILTEEEFTKLRIGLGLIKE